MAFRAGIIYGMKSAAQKLPPIIQGDFEEQKITVHVRKDLLARARRASQAGISETVRKGLELVAANDAFEGLRKMRGKVKFSIDLDELRKDKR
jgi:hypothetical protein